MHWHEPSATQFADTPPLRQPGVHLHTYLQSSKYFCAESIPEIQDLFSMQPEAPLTSMKEYLLENKHRVVVVHARQGDYVRFASFHNPYYALAIDKMLNVVQEPIFVFTSDDQNYCQRVRPCLVKCFFHETVFLPDYYSDVRAFALLQQFQHYIMSNSTFIWWCVWLAKNVKKVFVPSKWFGPDGPKSFEDIYEANWERLSSKTHHF